MSNRLEEFEKKLYKRDGETEKKQKSYEVYKEEDLFAPRPGWEEGRRFLSLAVSGFKIALILLALLAVGAAADVVAVEGDILSDITAARRVKAVFRSGERVL